MPTAADTSAALTYAPSAAEAFLLGLISGRESRNNPIAQSKVSSSSGLYGFIDGTWQAVAKITGVGGTYAHAKDAPTVDQSYNALWLLKEYGPNSPYSWAASGPYPTLAECEAAMQFA